MDTEFPKTAVEYIHSLGRFSGRPGLHRIRALCKACLLYTSLLDLGAGHGQLGIILLRGDAGHIGIIRKPG